MKNLPAMIMAIAGFSLAAFSMDSGPTSENDFLSPRGGEINECGHCLGRCFFYDHEESQADLSDCFTCNIEEQACCCASAAVGTVFSYVLMGAFACAGAAWAKPALTACGIADGGALCAACACYAPLKVAKYLGAEHFLASHEKGKYCYPKDLCSCTSLGCGFKGKKMRSCQNNCERGCCLALEASCGVCGSCCSLIEYKVIEPSEQACKASCRYCLAPCFQTYD